MKGKLLMSGKNSDKTYIFEQAPVPKALLSLAVPTIISQLINLIYNMVDAIYIGRTGDPYKTAAVSLSFTVFMMTIAFANLYGIGGGSYIARLIGRKDASTARGVCAFSIYSGIAIGLIYSLLIWVFMRPILNLFGASENTYGFAEQYLSIVIVAGSIPVILSLVLSHLLRNTGYAKQASAGLSGGGILNIILDPIFMFVLLPEGMEVVGAAIATLLSNIASCVYLLIIMKKTSSGSEYMSMKIADTKILKRADFKSIFGVGLSSAMLPGLFDVANIILNSLMAGHGDFQLAAIGIVMKVERLPNAVNIGLSQGLLPLVAYNYASGNHERMQRSISTARIWGISFSCVCIAALLLFGKNICGLFLSSTAGDAEKAAATLAFAATYITLRAPASLPQFFNYNTSFCMQAVGDGRDTVIHACVRILVFYIPLMFLLNSLIMDRGLAMALPISETLGAIFVLSLFSAWKKKNCVNL